MNNINSLNGFLNEASYLNMASTTSQIEGELNKILVRMRVTGMAGSELHG